MPRTRRALPLLLSLVALVWATTLACDEEASPPATGGIVQQITTDRQLVPGPEASGRVGDFVLDNGRARFVVQGPGPSTTWGLYGGAVVDAAALDARGNPTADRFEELFVQCDLRGFSPESAEIVEPGGPDRPGVLRFEGKDGGIPFLDVIIPRDPLDVRMTVDYVLAPDSDALEIRIAAKDLGRQGRRELSCGVVLLPGDAYRLFSPGRGFTDRVGGEQPALVGAGPAGTASYALHRPEGPLNVVLSGLPFLPVAPDPKPFLARATMRETYLLSVSGKSDVDGALRAAGAGEPGRPVRIRLDAPAVEALDRLRLRFAPPGADQPITEARADALGTVTATLPPATYEVRVEADDWDGALDAFELTVPAGEAAHAVSHAVAGLGVVRVRATETGLSGEDLGPTPARVRVTEGAPGGPVVYERYAPADHRFFLPAGAYAVAVSRGPEHELSVSEIEVRPGETTDIAAELVRVVDRAGWVSADLHVHGTRSTDSETPRRVRVLGAAAEGLDVLVSSDHDAVTDYGPVAAELGLEARLRTASGTEMSMLYGHMNGYPVAATQPEDHWRPGWFVYGEDGRFEGVREPHEVAEALRAEGAEVVQLNHPRSSQAVFGYLGFDPETGAFEGTFPDADAMELLNGKRFDEYGEVLADFHRLIVDGRRLTGVGTSDIHDDLGVGYARTYVRVDHAGALADLDLGEVWQGILQGRAVAASGPFVELALARGGEIAGVGQTLEGSGPATLSVRVQAPSWMTPERLRILAGREVLVDRPIRPEDADPVRPAVRLDATFTATVTADAYFMAEVTGSGGQAYLREVLTVTNPVWADAEGDGLRF